MRRDEIEAGPIARIIFFASLDVDIRFFLAFWWHELFGLVAFSGFALLASGHHLNSAAHRLASGYW